MSGGTVFSQTLIIIFLLSTSSTGEIIHFDFTEDQSSSSSDQNDATTWNNTQSTEYEDCSESNLSGPIIPCSSDEDPFAETYSVIEGLRYGGEEGFPFSDAYENRRVADPAVNPVMATQRKLTQAKSITWLVTSYRRDLKAHKVGESVMKVIQEMDDKKLETIFRKRLKFLSAISSVAQFVGPIFEVVLAFLPKVKSRELKAIETGFSETDAALDVLSLRLDQLEDKSDFNAVLSDLINFEASVDYGMTKYRAIAEYFDENDPEEELAPEGKTLLENLINYIGETGDIAKQLQSFTKHILQGTALAFDGERLLTTFRRGQQNDCSKILSFGGRLLNIIRNAQRLQFIYELNQGMIDYTDDKGYPREVHEIYVEVVEQYADCNRNVAKHAVDVSTRFLMQLQIVNLHVRYRTLHFKPIITLSRAFSRSFLLNS